MSKASCLDPESTPNFGNESSKHLFAGVSAHVRICLKIRYTPEIVLWKLEGFQVFRAFRWTNPMLRGSRRHLRLAHGASKTVTLREVHQGVPRGVPGRTPAKGKQIWWCNQPRIDFFHAWFLLAWLSWTSITRLCNDYNCSYQLIAGAPTSWRTEDYMGSMVFFGATLATSPKRRGYVASCMDMQVHMYTSNSMWDWESR